MEQFDEHVKQFNMERFASQRAAFLDSRIEAEREFVREHSRIQRVLTDKKKLRMGPKCLPVEDRIWLIRHGLTACHWCHDIFQSTGGGKTKSKWCMPRCKDRGRKSRNILEVKRMGSECYQVWKSLRGDRKAQEQYVQWIMFLADNLAPFQKRANNKKSGPYFDLKEGHYRRHTVQMAMRGKARDVSMEGVAGAMRLILVQENLDRFLRNKEVMFGHRRGGDWRCVVMSTDIGAHKIRVTIFYDPYAKRKDERHWAIAEMRDEILKTRATTKMKLPLLKMADFGANATEKGSLRHDANVLRVVGCELDYDDELMSIEEAVDKLRELNVGALVYTSPSNTKTVVSTGRRNTLS